MILTRPAQPRLTGGDDHPETPCTRDVDNRLAARRLTGTYPPSPFDILTDGHRVGLLRHAAAEAATLCADCPILGRCMAENRHEEWVQNLIRHNPERQTNPAKENQR